MISTTHRITLDLRSSLVDDPRCGHNRWHPDIEPAIRVQPGDTLIADTRDGTDGQIGPDTPIDAIRSADIGRIHPLSGPIFVEGAEPGDMLEVEILEIEPASYGFTRFSPGDGILGDLVEEMFVARWMMRDGFATSPDIPGVRIPAAPFIGVIGVAPSPERLARYVAREAAVAADGGIALPPDPHCAVPSSEPAASEGVRTIPPRETGGNMDVKNLRAGSRIWLPVDVPGSLLSLGDVHFAQGDGEACGQGLEMQARVHLRVNVRKARDLSWKQSGPTIEYTEIPRTGRYLSTTGIPVASTGRIADMDLTLAMKNALAEMLSYLMDVRGYTWNQAYALASVAVDLHISQAVNIPNVLVSARVPLDIFE